MRRLLLGLLCSAGLLAEGAPGRPDIMLLVADDLGWNDVGWHNPEIRTPNLDALVAGGLELDWHYVQPQCTPTRVALLTGRYPSRFGPHCTMASNEQAIPFGTPTLASVLAKAGYETGIFGKWHLGSLPKWGPRHYGFAHSYGSFAGACGIWDHRYRLNRPPYTRTWHRNGEFVNEDGHSLELCTTEAVRWIRRQPADRPIFCYLPFHAVHTPLAERDERWFRMNGHIEDPDRRHFAAYVSHLDEAIGRLVSLLKETGRYQHTIIVFTSDNGGVVGPYRGGAYPKPDPMLKAGFSSNEPLKGGKSTSHEGGIRVPAFIHWPERIAPGTHRGPVHAIDWLPTLQRLVPGAEPIAGLDGLDLHRELLANRPGKERTIYTVWNRFGRQVALHRGTWKIRAAGKGTATFTDFDWELYNLAEDPNETTDLAARHPGKVESLARLFMAERARDANPATSQ